MLGSVDDSDREFILVSQSSCNGLAGRQGHGCFRPRAPGVKHLLFKLQPLIAGGDPGKVAGGRVAGGASARSVEVLLPRLNIASLQIGHGDAAAIAKPGLSLISLRVNEGDQTGDLRISEVELRHAFIRPPLAHNRADLVPADVCRDQLGTG